MIATLQYSTDLCVCHRDVRTRLSVTDSVYKPTFACHCESLGHSAVPGSYEESRVYTGAIF